MLLRRWRAVNSVLLYYSHSKSIIYFQLCYIPSPIKLQESLHHRDNVNQLLNCIFMLGNISGSLKHFLKNQQLHRLTTYKSVALLSILIFNTFIWLAEWLKTMPKMHLGIYQQNDSQSILVCSKLCGFHATIKSKLHLPCRRICCSPLLCGFLGFLF